ncbi:MAG: DUF4625 domain-containing protein [Bacteroidales bacterium]|nr:DUF4625 domain-containing protein [Bacteroidales bacterium]
MKNIILTIAAVAALAFLSVSCKKDNAPAKPVVTFTEVGHDNSKHAMRGDDMHLEAEIVAEGLIKRIDVEIHKENGGFEIEKSFTEGKYIGVKNTEFHEHIYIPADAPLGEYHLHFTVTDQAGQTVTAEEHIEVIEFDEDHHHDEEE